MDCRHLWAAGALALASAAQAQTPPARPAPARPTPAPRAAPPSSVEGVTVTAPTQELRTSIDRRSYSITDDLQTTTGSIADALKNVPSLEVNVQGEVSLRGDPNVTILIDGKPSGMFRGEGRGDALQQLPADQIERVEVITNPSAAYSPEGGGGVINLITKQGRGAGGSGSVRGQMGTQGRYNLGASGAYNSRKLTVSGDASLRRNDNKGTATDRRITRDGERLAASAFGSAGDNVSVRGGVDYDLNPRDRISGEVRLNRYDMTSQTAERYETFSPAGALLTQTDRVGGFEGGRNNAEASATWRRKIAEGHELVVDLSKEHNTVENDRRFDLFPRRPANFQTFEVLTSDTTEDQLQLKADYTRPMSGEATLKAGFDLQQDENEYDNRGFRGPGPITTVIDPTLNSHFLFEQIVSAAYATYERPFGDWTLQAGLRFEAAQTTIDLLDVGGTSGNDYSRLYPSLHVGYRIDDESQLRASYSHRIRRPGPNDLNPYRVYVDLTQYRAGNPRLEPSETHSLEVGYQKRAGQTYYLATLFWRENYNTVTDVIREVEPGVLLTTRENLGESRSGGLELVANGRLTPKLTYNLSGSTFWNELDAGGLSASGPRSGFNLTGRANLNWQPSSRDLLQLNVFGATKRITAQGYNRPTYGVNLGYRRKVTDRWTLTATAQDVLDSMGRARTVVDTPALRREVDQSFSVRGVFVGLNYAFGSRRQQQREPGFEFESGGGVETP